MVSTRPGPGFPELSEEKLGSHDLSLDDDRGESSRQAETQWGFCRCAWWRPLVRSKGASDARPPCRATTQASGASCDARDRVGWTYCGVMHDLPDGDL